MNIEEIKAVKKYGTAKHFGYDIDAEAKWLHRALDHAMQLLDVAVEHVDSLRQEWRELETR